MRSKVCIFPVRVITPIIAPMKENELITCIAKMYGLDKKYDPEDIPHIDRLFYRVIIGGEQKVWISGKATKGAIHYTLRQKALSLLKSQNTSDTAKQMAKKILSLIENDKTQIFGITFDEDFVFLEKLHRTDKAGNPGIMTTEIIIPGAIGQLIIFGEPPQIYYTVPRIWIGAQRSGGYGLIEIDWNKKEEKESFEIFS